MPKFNEVMGNLNTKIEEEERGLANRTKAAQSLGAQKSASFIGSITGNPKKKYRVAYGYINENRGKNDPIHIGEKYINADTFDEAADQYKKLGWLKNRDEKGRRYVMIQDSEDDFSTEPAGSYFYDTQHW